jgi:hypothetical protein
MKMSGGGKSRSKDKLVEFEYPELFPSNQTFLD